MLLIFSSLLQSGLAGPSAWPVDANWLLAPSRGQLVGDLSPVVATMRVPLSINFAAILPAGDTLAANGGRATLSAYSGADPNAALLLWGGPSVAGSIVTQWAGPGWLPGVIYTLTLTAPTVDGALLTLSARVAAQAIN